MRIDTLSVQPAPPGASWPPGWRSLLGHTHTYSGRSDHGGPVRPPESYASLARWCRERGIDALGMGSPYTPHSAATYHRYDGSERDRYYSGEVEPHSLLHEDELERMLAAVNAASHGRTLFYLDNETPKGRFGHMWWLGYRQVVPPWHDYDQPFDRWMLTAPEALGEADEPMPYERRPYRAIVAEQRARGALGIWAHPTSWWWGEDGRFVTNIATEMPAHALAAGRLDGLVVMGYQPHRPEYQAIWFALLDRGCCVPGVAEMDCGLSDPALWQKVAPLLTYAWAPDDQLDLAALQAALRSGRVFASSGPFVELTIDGHPMGDVVPGAGDRTHTAVLTALPRPGGTPLDRIELVGRGGDVVWRQNGFGGGSITLAVEGSPEPGYLVPRVTATDLAIGEWRQPSQVAVGNPVYLHPPGTGFAAAMTTRVELTIGTQSPFAGGDVRFEADDGQLLGRAAAVPGTLHETLPATGRVTLTAPDGHQRTDYLLNANARLLAVQRHLYRGRFLRDHAGARPGQVPLAAWQLHEYEAALREVRCSY